MKWLQLLLTIFLGPWWEAWRPGTTWFKWKRCKNISMLNVHACGFLSWITFFFSSFIRWFICPFLLFFFIYLSVDLVSHSVSQSLWQAVSLAACRSICPSVHLSVRPSIHPIVSPKQQMTVYFKGSCWKPWANWREWTTRRSSNVMFLLSIFTRYLDT